MVLNVDMHEVIVCQTPYDYILLNKLNCGAGTKLAINNIDWQSNVDFSLLWYVFLQA